MAVLYTPQYYYMAISNLTAHIPHASSNQQTLQLKSNIDTDIANVDNTIDRLKTQLSALAADIDVSKTNKDNLRTSGGMYDDSRNLYITKLLENYLLFISICWVSYGIYKSNTTP